METAADKIISPQRPLVAGVALMIISHHIHQQMEISILLITLWTWAGVNFPPNLCRIYFCDLLQRNKHKQTKRTDIQIRLESCQAQGEEEDGRIDVQQKGFPRSNLFQLSHKSHGNR